jgi:hypothetical protein
VIATGARRRDLAEAVEVGATVLGDPLRRELLHHRPECSPEGLPPVGVADVFGRDDG